MRKIPDIRPVWVVQDENRIIYGVITDEDLAKTFADKLNKTLDVVVTSKLWLATNTIPNMNELVKAIKEKHIEIQKYKNGDF